ncbi:MAG: hypothetical protein U1C46_02030 [Bacteroidales bacterium]|nr:hypothetical protein [Bacteroidales bacterium]MDZ4203573.1 hypothetical protein [Bacteroidales bacterium]
MEENSLINYHILELKMLENFSERTKNICLDNSLETIYKLIEYYNEHGGFQNLRNCGTKSNGELVSMIEKYIGRFKVEPEMLTSEGHHRSFEEYKIFCFEQFGLGSEEAEKFRHSFIEERFPFFQFILLILKRLLNPREFFLFEHNFSYFNNKKKLTLQAAGNLYGITRERIRQVSHDIPFKTREILSAFSLELHFITNYLQYDLKFRKDMILVDQQTADTINKMEGMDCTTRFFAFGLSILFQNDYYFFQEDIHDYRNYYLVNRDHATLFDFSEFYHQLSLENQTRRKTDQLIDFGTFLQPFYRRQGARRNKHIEDLCKFIAQQEFNFEVTPTDQFVLPRNTIIRLSERIFDIIKEKGRPMHLKEIFAQLKSRGFRVPPSIESLRSSVLISDEIVALGKTSTYALKEWSQLKTGTIKKIAKDYLEQQDKPVHLSELSKYVNQYRKTLDKNIYANLKLDHTGTFIFFKGGFIGLRSKNYLSLGSTPGQLELL